MKEFHSLGEIIDCSEDEFREYCSDKNVGYLTNLHNLMVQTYNHTSDTNKALVAKVSTMKKGSEEFIEAVSTLNGLFSKLLRIEQRVFIIRELIDKLNKVEN